MLTKAERIKRARAAAFGASFAATSARSRNSASPGNWFPRLQPPSADRLALLLDRQPSKAVEDREEAVARIHVASLLDATTPKLSGYVDTLLNHKERDARSEYLKSLPDFTFKKEAGGRVCRYCRHRYQLADISLNDSLQAVVVNHGARIVTDFNPDRNVASAEIKGFQLFVNGRNHALELLKSAHPLNWSKTAVLFRRSDAAVPVGDGWYSKKGDREEIATQWRRSGKEGQTQYLYEDVSWPWNEYVSADVQNIIGIKGISGIEGVPDQMGFQDELDNYDPASLSISYAYELEECLSSNFGVAFERGGLDTDSGYYHGFAKRVKYAKPSPARDVPLDSEYTANPQNVAGIKAASNIKPGSPALLQRLWDVVANEWDDPYLVTIGARKELRYTRPKNGPDELMSFLNWMSPALLFVFLNRSICESVHFLSDQLDQRRPTSISRPSPTDGPGLGLGLQRREEKET